MCLPTAQGQSSAWNELITYNFLFVMEDTALRIFLETVLEMTLVSILGFNEIESLSFIFKGSTFMCHRTNIVVLVTHKMPHLLRTWLMQNVLQYLDSPIFTLIVSLSKCGDIWRNIIRWDEIGALVFNISTRYIFEMVYTDCKSHNIHKDI